MSGNSEHNHSEVFGRCCVCRKQQALEWHSARDDSENLADCRESERTSGWWVCSMCHQAIHAAMLRDGSPGAAARTFGVVLGRIQQGTLNERPRRYRRPKAVN